MGLLLFWGDIAQNIFKSNKRFGNKRQKITQPKSTKKGCGEIWLRTELPHPIARFEASQLRQLR